MPDLDKKPSQAATKFEDAFESIKTALKTLRFGAIQLIVHEGHIVQLEVTERHRFPL